MVAESDKAAVGNGTSVTGGDGASAGDDNRTTIDSGIPNNLVSARKGNKTGIIVGAVVGVVGALALIVLAAWYFRRRATRGCHAASGEKEQPLVPATSAGSEDTSLQSTSRQGGSDPSLSPATHNTAAGPAPRRRRVVQEQDAMYGAGYPAPPSYRGTWLGMPQAVTPTLGRPSRDIQEESAETSAQGPDGRLLAEYKRVFVQDQPPPIVARGDVKS